MATLFMQISEPNKKNISLVRSVLFANFLFNFSVLCSLWFGFLSFFLFMATNLVEWAGRLVHKSIPLH